MIKEKYQASTIDEILELIEVDKKKYKAKEQILKKEIKRSMPLFWKKRYVYEVEFDVDDIVKVSKPKNEKDEILAMLNKPIQTIKQEETTAISTMESPILVENTTTEEEKMKKLNTYREKLIDSEINEKIVNDLLERTKKELTDLDYENEGKIETEVLNQMKLMMGDTFQFKLSEAKKMVMIGPTGVGKTTTIGKIASILVLQGKTVGFITTDIYRMGAVYQLKEYAKILNSTMEPATTPQELEQAIDYFENVEKVDHILIDTVGRSPMDAGNIEDMKSYLEIAKPDHISLVLSCTQKEKDIYKIIENFKTANINSLIFTKLDETLNHGVIMNVISDKKAKVSFITNGQDVPQDIYIADTEKLASKILRGVDEFERPSI